MDLKYSEDIVKNPEGGLGVGPVERDKLISSLQHEHGIKEIDSASALQLFLDHIPISSIPGIKNSPAVVELKTGDSVKDAIQLLYDNDVYGAPIAVVSDYDETTRGLPDRYIGFIDLASMVLWSLEEFEKCQSYDKGNGVEVVGNNGFFSILEQNPQIGETKVGELAKSFLWQPFFPVHLDDSLFHVLLLFSKHRLQVVPVVEQSSSQVIGFVTQNAVIQLLLQSSGVDWFDNIADKAILEFRFEHEGHVSHVYGDQSIAEAFHILWEDQIGAIAIFDKGTKRIIGSISGANVHLLLDNYDIFCTRKEFTVEDFIHLDTGKAYPAPTIEKDLAALLLAGSLRLRNSFLPKMDSTVTAKRADTLKQTVQNLSETKSNFIFLIDDLGETTGVITLRDIIIQFAPPCMDSRISGGGFFESALEQTGCRIENRTMVCDR